MPLGMTKAETTALYTSVKAPLFPRGNWNNTSGSCTLRERWTPLHLASTQAGTAATNSILMTMVSVTKQRHLENIVWLRLHMKVRWSVFCSLVEFSFKLYIPLFKLIIISNGSYYKLIICPCLFDAITFFCRNKVDIFERKFSNLALRLRRNMIKRL